MVIYAVDRKLETPFKISSMYPSMNVDLNFPTCRLKSAQRKLGEFAVNSVLFLGTFPGDKRRTDICLVPRKMP